MVPRERSDMSDSVADTPDALVTVTHVRKGFGDVLALADVSLTVRAGEFVALVGPSGCGKSTLLSLIAGLDTPTTGTITTRSSHAAMVFQEAALFPWRTVRDNVAFGLEMQGVGKAERLARADEVLRLVHLQDFAGSYPHTLSGGMRQRVALARALAIDSPLLLMDEPFAALDEQTRLRLHGELISIWQATGRAIILVTHGLDEAIALADRIVLFSARPGRILEDIAVPTDRPRDIADPALATLRRHLFERLAEETVEPLTTR